MLLSWDRHIDNNSWLITYVSAQTLLNVRQWCNSKSILQSVHVSLKCLTHQIDTLKFRSFVAVAAIDFGTTYSGCAFSTVQDFKTDKLSIVTIPLDDQNVISYKTPTVLLLTPEKQFHSFGAMAEDHYVYLAQRDEANMWYYFDRFKMQLYRAKVFCVIKNMYIKFVNFV